eukprot:CAMPEP_0118947246 /NCGR_PEP_ID=MMETSP1169-20130426/45670_1 /TAXON_ID=36882 /ORGANISM="Pyramimonas obovata, Strain CCMP722" /LENGTH=124 /DNA_ID=CAMNT_0006893423 /DNA_START=399 /DNA_END=770 /DNA_ORIENTATION=+
MRLLRFRLWGWQMNEFSSLVWDMNITSSVTSAGMSIATRERSKRSSISAFFAFSDSVIWFEAAAFFASARKAFLRSLSTCASLKAFFSASDSGCSGIISQALCVVGSLATNEKPALTISFSVKV